MKQPYRVSTNQSRKQIHKSIKHGCLIGIIFCLSLSLCSGLVIANEFPTIHLLSPTGGETLSGIVEVTWNSMGDNYNLDIFLYYVHVENMSWVLINPEGIDDTGRYSWNTIALSDGAYCLRVQGINHENEMGLDTSDVFIVDNDQANINITNVMILDRSTNSVNVVKDLDCVQIHASIISDENLSPQDITVDLTGFGYDMYQHPDQFDGTNATWYCNQIQCNPKNGDITIIIDVKRIESEICVVKADNIPPAVRLLKPGNGIFLFNRQIWKSFPFADTFIIGPITVIVDAQDESEISRVQYILNDVIMYTTQNLSSWRIQQRLHGPQKLVVSVIDAAGNKASVEKTMIIHNSIGF